MAQELLRCLPSQNTTQTLVLHSRTELQTFQNRTTYVKSKQTLPYLKWQF